MVNSGITGWGSEIEICINSLYAILNTKFKSGDIVINLSIFRYTDDQYFESYIHDYSIPFNKNTEINCFIEGESSHIDAHGNEILAEYIFNDIKALLDAKNVVGKPINFLTTKHLGDEENLQLNEYIKRIKQNKFCESSGLKTGAIVMNCNPFTLGHQYLIAESLKVIDYLYVFVVEEDKSFFSFKDRFKMVKAACKNYNNVKVFPSGKYMISALTFADYFNKESLQQGVTINPSFDVELFASKIAPALNIRFRFVGEEPFDYVTAQYNISLKEVLPEYGIELIEIPRYQVEGEMVSATKVRRLLKSGDYDGLKNYLPETSYQYIRKNRK